MELIVDRGTDRLAVTVRENPDADTIVVMIPAMGVPAGYYDRFAAGLVEAGFAAAVADLRGTGGSRPRPSRASRYGYGELAGDVAAVLEALVPQRNGRRTILLGHSLGGQVSLIHLTRGQAGVDGLVLIAVGLPYWRTYGRKRLGVYGFIQGIALTSSLLRVWPGWGFGGRQARRVMLDWAATGRHGAFPAHLAAEEKLSGITLPVLAISVDNDQFTPRGTMDFLLAKLTGARLTRLHLTTEAAGASLDHFKWVRAGAPLAKEIRQFSNTCGPPNRTLSSSDTKVNPARS